VRNCKNTSSQCRNCDANCINFKLTNLMADKIMHLEIMAKFDETGLNQSEKGRTYIYVSDDSTSPGKRRDYFWHLAGLRKNSFRIFHHHKMLGSQAERSPTY